jgi:hypothetical protein
MATPTASMKMSKASMDRLLYGRGEASVFLLKGVRHILRSVEREDGSGKSFNLHARRESDNAPRTIYVRVV